MIKVGNSVVVKKGVIDPDSDIPVDGWQGRISEIEKRENGEISLLITLDSITLKNMPISYLEECENKGLDWKTYYLGPEDVEPVEARDTQKDVANAVKQIEKQVGWLSLGGEEGKRIQKILAGIDLEDESGALEVWEEYLHKKLSFPFEAEISEYQEKGPLQSGDKLTVTNMSETDDEYGIMVKVKRGSEKFEFPLCDLEVVGKKASESNKQVVSDYGVWFTNH